MYPGYRGPCLTQGDGQMAAVMGTPPLAVMTRLFVSDGTAGANICRRITPDSGGVGAFPLVLLN